MTRLQVANAAINLLNGSPLSTWGESTRNGTLASLHLPFAIKQVLREAPWSETLQVLELESTDEVTPVYPNTGMVYAYALPGDVFHLFEVNGKKTGWKLIDDVLHTNESQPDILYSTEPASDSIPEEVGHIAAFLLAYYLAPSITQDTNKAMEMLQQFRILLSNEKDRVEQQLGDGDSSSGWWTD